MKPPFDVSTIDYAVSQEHRAFIRKVLVRAREHIAELQAIIDKHDLCHNLHGKVDARAFADGCADEQRKHFGCAPDSDEVKRLKALVVEAIGQLCERCMGSGFIQAGLVTVPGRSEKRVCPECGPIRDKLGAAK